MMEAEMSWEELMLEGYPGWGPITFGALDIRHLDREEQSVEINPPSYVEPSQSPPEIPDDIQ